MLGLQERIADAATLSETLVDSVAEPPCRRTLMGARVIEPMARSALFWRPARA
jgi:hypothetical protein